MENWDKLLDELINYWETLFYQLKDADNSASVVLNSQLSEQELKVIIFLGKNGDERMKDIAEHMNLVVSSLTSIADKLVEKNYVERKRSESDRRIVRLSLTKKGQSFFSELRKIKKTKGREILGLLDNEDKKVYVELMRKMVERSRIKKEKSKKN
ncbi:MAG: MarR family transcriptional regulator [Desulforegulaceae bacterium]|nr:MarR family transcriptional regulator [Desulforegulaceae bacterium]